MTAKMDLSLLSSLVLQAADLQRDVRLLDPGDDGWRDDGMERWTTDRLSTLTLTFRGQHADVAAAASDIARQLSKETDSAKCHAVSRTPS